MDSNDRLYQDFTKCNTILTVCEKYSLRIKRLKNFTTISVLTYHQKIKFKALKDGLHFYASLQVLFS